MDKFSDMTLFVSIVKHQGLAAAGKGLGLCPPTGTARPQAIEERQGVQLHNRSTRHDITSYSGGIYHQAGLYILGSLKQ
ncbi:LysR family transcriptional regulator, partial [Vibrio parahaemolyticus]|uniref:LysR family transcriptional regulator n=1 Tax=Vibrio parahaemolyticus TaxID=670 RepID=UPI0005F26AFC